MSDSVRPHRWQPTRLRCPWDSPGKNTGVGCHFLVQCIKVKVKSLSHVWLFATWWTSAYQAPLSMGFSRQEYWSGLSLPSLSVPSTVPFILQLDFFQNLVKELSFMILPLTPPPKTKPGEHFSYPFLYLFLLKRWECVNIHLFLLKRWGC